MSTLGSNRLRGIAVLVIGAAMVTACGGTAASPTAASPTAAPATAAPATAAPATATPVPSIDGVVVNGVVFPKPEKTTVKVGLSASAASGLMGIYYMESTQLYKKYGVTLEFTRLSGASQTVQAMLANQVDVADASGGAAISSQLTDSPFQDIYVTKQTLTDGLFSAASVKTAADLKGKSIAISSYGSTSHAEALLALKSLGLTDKDVTLTLVGNDSARLAALKAGSVAASIDDPTYADSLKALGFNELVFLPDVKGIGGFATTSLNAPEAFQKANPNTSLILAAIWMEATNAIFNPADLETHITNWMKEAGVDQAQAQKDLATLLSLPWTPRDGKCDPATWNFMKEVLVVANADLATVDPLKACNQAYVDQLVALGFPKTVGVPGY